MKVLVVGAGPIAREYIKVILKLGYRVVVIGKGEENTNAVKNLFPEAEVYSGGLEVQCKKIDLPKFAIIATPIEYLASACLTLLENGVKNILAEKPLSYSINEVKAIQSLAQKVSSNVYIAYNRRNYQSVIKAKELIARDGGVSSFHFDFTEAVFRIHPEKYSQKTVIFWGIANSTHVIDTAFYLGGRVKKLEAKQYGNAVPWHAAGSVFTGMGETESGIPFTYHANWGCPGKWNIEIMTSERKLLFSPMERLHQQKKGSFGIELVDLDYSLDVDFKPGFMLQTKYFLESNSTSLHIQDYSDELSILNQIFNY